MGDLPTPVEAIAMVSDKSRVLRLEGKKNFWGRAFNAPHPGWFNAVGYMPKKGDVLIGPSGTTMAIFVEADKMSDPRDLTVGRYVSVGPDVAGAQEVFELAHTLRDVPIYGIVSTY